uniref:IclR-ED domain-containing protein n=1 Tax=Globodera pallida TaxID=36090 RepID=A0A183BHX1_GLOPA
MCHCSCGTCAKALQHHRMCHAFWLPGVAGTSVQTFAGTPPEAFAIIGPIERSLFVEKVQHDNMRNALRQVVELMILYR